MLDMINYFIRISVKSGMQQHHVFLKTEVLLSDQKTSTKFLGISQRFTLALTRNKSPTVYISREKGDFFTRTCTNICQQTTAKVMSVLRGYNLSGVTYAPTRNLCFCGYFQRTASCFYNVILVTIPI